MTSADSTHPPVDRADLYRRALAILGEDARNGAVGDEALLRLFDKLCDRVAEQDRQLAALILGAARYQTLVEHAFESVNVLGVDGTFIYIGPNNVKLLGYQPEEMTGRSGFDLVHPDDLYGTKARFAEMLRHPG